MLFFSQIVIRARLTLALAFAILVLTKAPGSSFAALSPFECGFKPIGDSRAPFSIQFFLIALVFLIFDVELILLFPVLAGKLALFALHALGYALFLGLITAGFL